MSSSQHAVSALWLIEQSYAATPPRIIDMRKMAAFEASGHIVPGARWHDHENIESWASEYQPGDELIVYCVHGHEVSQNTTAKLCSLGYNARFVEGGIAAYEEAGGKVDPAGSGE
ncbi:MAG: hypothetical protein GY927_00195 [bacterium]|nr:hypothetical protein [bacterium]